MRLVRLGWKGTHGPTRLETLGARTSTDTDNGNETHKGTFPCYTLTLVTAYAPEHNVHTVVFALPRSSFNFGSEVHQAQKPLSVILKLVDPLTISVSKKLQIRN